MDVWGAAPTAAGRASTGEITRSEGVRTVATLPAEYLDPHTPADVLVVDRMRPRIEDPTLGVPLGVRPPEVLAPPAAPTHPLITVGDSLTHGVSSGAVSRTDRTWPAIVARGLGVAHRSPTYGGPLGGLPFNIEGLLRRLQDRFADEIRGLELVELPVALQRLADENEDYWERGDGSAPPRTDHPYDNIGIYGWDLRRCLSYTADRARARLTEAAPHDDLFGTKPSNDNDIAALSVLAPFGSSAAQIDAADWHGRSGGIDTLIVALGANNALGSVVHKKVRWSDVGFADLDTSGDYTVWRPTHFAVEYAALVRRLESISARRVVVATVPHVTVAPIANGVNPDRPGAKWRDGSRYFPYYTDPWIDEQDFSPAKHRHLTHQQARAVDSAIDQYNDTITDAVRRARRVGRDWLLFDLCGLLDGLAFRRFAEDAAAADRNGWGPYPLPAALADLDTRFFRSDRTGRLQGGLFGLDGVHPTTSGYGIVAAEILKLLALDGTPCDPVDFAALRRQDSLNEDPPALMTALFTLAAPFLTRLISRS